MGSLIQPTPVVEEPDSSRRTIIIAVVAVIAITIAAALLLRARAEIVQMLAVAFGAALGHGAAIAAVVALQPLPGAGDGLG